MRPLSVFRSIWGNRRRTMPVMAAVALSVFLISTMQSVVGVPQHAVWRELVEPYRYVSAFAAKTEPLRADFVKALSQVTGVAAAVPCAGFYTNIDSVAGGSIGTQVLAIDAGGLPQVLPAMGLTLAHGSLPKSGTDEIALHETVARNKGLWIGDAMGSDVQQGEMLEGRHTVCGILHGEAILSVTSLEYELVRRNIAYEYSLGALILAQQGQSAAMNDALERLDRGGLVLRTLQTAINQYQRDTSSISLLTTAIGILTILIVSVCTGFLSYIHFLQRRGEQGILCAIGYTEMQIVSRAFAEISLVNLAGLGAGLLAATLSGLLMNTMFFLPKGLSLQVLAAESLLGSFCVPLFTTLFSVIPVWRMLRGLDAASVLEGRL